MLRFSIYVFWVLSQHISVSFCSVFYFSVSYLEAIQNHHMIFLFLEQGDSEPKEYSFYFVALINSDFYDSISGGRVLLS